MRYVGGFDGMRKLGATMLLLALDDFQDGRPHYRATAEFFLLAGVLSILLISPGSIQTAYIANTRS